jgi:hypothetical protein
MRRILNKDELCFGLIEGKTYTIYRREEPNKIWSSGKFVGYSYIYGDWVDAKIGVANVCTYNHLTSEYHHDINNEFLVTTED